VWAGGAWVGQELDTGWVDVEPASGFTGTLQVRRVGLRVQVRGDLIGTVPVGATTVGAIIDTNLMPTDMNARGACYLAGGTAGVSYVTTSGTIGVAHQSGTTKANPSLMCDYLR